VIATLLSAVRLALSAIVRNKTRAALTILGILIGITAVIVVVALGESTSKAVGGQIDSFAANAIFVWPQPMQASGAKSKFVGRLTENDGRAIAREAVSVSGVAPWLSTAGQVVFRDKNWQTELIGTTLSYFPIRRWEIARGGNWSESDEILKTKVCLIGNTVASNLFGTLDPIGQTIRIARSPYRVIGVLGARGTSPFGDDQDDRVMMPIGSFRARIMHTAPGRTDQLIIGATSEQTVNRAKEQIEGVLRQRHHLDDGRDDFEVSSQAEMRETMQAIADTLRALQFLVEAIALTLIGGTLGILLGTAGAVALGRALEMQMAPSAWALEIAVATSIGIGTVFGFLPAWRAAKLDPIAALRVE
jgi:putative ABC transport system permease protein